MVIQLKRIRIAQLLIGIAACCLVALWFRAQPAGIPRKTDRQLDVAIFGKGYFQVADLQQGTLYYTRKGGLGINANGMLVVGRAEDGWVLHQPSPFLLIGRILSSHLMVSFQLRKVRRA